MIKFNFTTPTGVIYKGDVLNVSVPTTSGVISILSDHTPLISTIKSGELVIVDRDGESSSYAVYNGVVHVKDISESHYSTEVNVLVASADDVEELDEKSLKEALQRAEEIEQNGESFEDVGLNSSPIERELNRIRLAKKHAR